MPFSFNRKHKDVAADADASPEITTSSRSMMYSMSNDAAPRTADEKKYHIDVSGADEKHSMAIYKQYPATATSKELPDDESIYIEAATEPIVEFERPQTPPQGKSLSPRV